MKGGIIMRDYIRTITEVPDRRQELASQLEASADRICDLQERLMDGTDKLKPAEYDRLLDAYRAELVRYDRLDREMETLEEPKKAKRYKEMQQRQNRENREKINY
ncbi:hypothetical protein HMPREF9447_01725 [Bacteroides oleiciplenus YIT 12058]|uniref:Uncharacterized protein n=2 Tax=Bacteroides oleiciplenus TaxID=626931 RepID=K9EH91_9BACE|nr:hypothetical protein HMPREF9447_01725 [Bacteroides oleiciplenus YIT 12058]